MFRKFLVLCLCTVSVMSKADDDIWLLVDTHAFTLEVKQGEKTVELLENIAIGRNGAGLKMHRGDNITPIGTYKIGWINQSSAFYRFFGLTYPSVDDASVALKQGVIDPFTFDSIAFAHNNNRVPPQNTLLGGQIGIHGLGRGNEKIHRTMNWTHGCIALTNPQIDRLSKWIKKEVVVEVR
ncbi:MAG: L,D-transpeptidase [Methylomicrobium sp.]|nr:L,D-transpeptidase [Methylomicrobium sp.]